uniref:C-type lectin domain-containing protein n=1 Tax=Acanthochromis polyacanthus TaxID=80966 RepID=A0A3Q1FHX9_9TELE
MQSSTVSEGANLVSIHSADEQNFVNSLIKTFDPAQKWTWIGLSEVHKDGAWMWSDGSKVNFVFWGTGEPNNLGGQEDCVHTNFGTEFKWNDRPCLDNRPFVCASRPVFL